MIDPTLVLRPTRAALPDLADSALPPQSSHTSPAFGPSPTGPAVALAPPYHSSTRLAPPTAADSGNQPTSKTTSRPSQSVSPRPNHQILTRRTSGTLPSTAHIPRSGFAVSPHSPHATRRDESGTVTTRTTLRSSSLVTLMSPRTHLSASATALEAWKGPRQAGILEMAPEPSARGIPPL